MPRFEYRGNNSGGSYWLGETDWTNLVNAGWVREDNWQVASKDFDSMDAAIQDFEDITGQNYNAVGCTCCGRPHWISEVEWREEEYDDYDYLD